MFQGCKDVGNLLGYLLLDVASYDDGRVLAILISTLLVFKSIQLQIYSDHCVSGKLGTLLCTMQVGLTH